MASLKSVLIVDDDPGTVETLADILQAKAYCVATAHSGEAAVSMVRGKAVRKKAYGVVVLDIRMPGMNGVEALRAIKAIEPRTKAIMITAYTQHELVQEARRESVLDVLPKPVEIDRLVTLIEQVTQ